MVSLVFLDDSTKSKIVGTWKSMSESDKAHFINQVALALSVWGSDDMGKRMVVEILELMAKNGTETLADFGLFIDRAAGLPAGAGFKDRIKRASMIIEGYRIKNSMPSEPHKELDL